MRRSGASGGRFGGDGDTEDGHGGSGGGGILGCTEGPVCYIKPVVHAAGEHESVSRSVTRVAGQRKYRAEFPERPKPAARRCFLEL